MELNSIYLFIGVIVVFVVMLHSSKEYGKEKERFENIPELSDVFTSEGGNVSLKGIKIPPNGILKGNGKLTFGSAKEFNIDSGGKKIDIRGGLGISGNANITGTLNIGGKIVIGDNAIELNKDGTAKFKEVQIRDKYNDDIKAQSIYKKEYKSPMLLGAVYELNSRRQDYITEFSPVTLITGGVTTTTSRNDSTFILNRRNDTKER